MLSAKLKKEHIFERILADLREPVAAIPQGTISTTARFKYELFSLVVSREDLFTETRPEDFVVHSEKYGIPQARHRIIIVGIRSDIRMTPSLLTPDEPATVKEVLSDLPILRSGLSKEADSSEAWFDAVVSIGDASWIGKSAVEEELREALFINLNRFKAKSSRGGRFVPKFGRPARHARWYHDDLLRGACNHETRGHIRADLHRYFFAAVFARKYGRSPLLEDLPKALLPRHKNVQDALIETKFNDRFRVQLVWCT